jgi:uncharacterized protein
MKPQLSHCKLLVKKSPIHGYGVFADQEIQSDEMIEECHVLPIPVNNKQCNPNLNNYTFTSPLGDLLSLGFGSTYNHSDQPNARFDTDEEHSLLIFYATKRIKQGEEILISYGENWFSSRRLKPKNLSFRYRLRKFFPAIMLSIRFGMTVTALYLFIWLFQHLPAGLL